MDDPPPLFSWVAPEPSFSFLSAPSAKPDAVAHHPDRMAFCLRFYTLMQEEGTVPKLKWN